MSACTRALTRERIPTELAPPLSPKQVRVLHAIAAASTTIATITLHTASTDVTGSINDCGDAQLGADLAADAVCTAALRASGAVEITSSEESTAEADAGGAGYSVAFDPLDGSSILSAGWAVGAIFGVWPGKGLVGRPGRDQAAAAYALFGSRTLLVIARPVSGAGAPHTVDEHELGPDGRTWARVRAGVRLNEAALSQHGSGATHGTTKFFAPANLRCAALGSAAGQDANAPYRALVDAHLGARATLRYTGGLVPDLHHILSKGAGAFLNPASAGAPPKLRLLYEVAPLSLIMEAAGGAADDGAGRALDQAADTPDARTVVAFGEPAVVAAAREALRFGGYAGGQRGERVGVAGSGKG
jgi:sedoheptulose-bisphosphatase